MRTALRSLGLAFSLALLVACASPPTGPRAPGDAPAAPLGDPFPNWPAPPITGLAKLQEIDRAPVEVRSNKAAGGGTTGAEKVEVYFPSLGRDVKFKVKRLPPFLDGINNSPRREVAAAYLQPLFLEPVDFVVPSTMLRCIPAAEWAERHLTAKPTLEGTSCVLVTVSLWLKDVTLPDVVYDEQRFQSDARYAYHLANFNVFTYLAAHRDTRSGNILVSTNESDRRVFAIDNGTTFSTPWFNWLYPPSYHWHDLRVPALPRATVERLRALRRQDLDVLAVVSQLEADGEGILRNQAPGIPIDPDQGVSVVGTTAQFGLTESEIDDVWKRIEKLLERVDEGELALF